MCRSLRITLVAAVVLAASLLTLVATAPPDRSERRAIGDALTPSRAQRPATLPASPRDWRLTPLGGGFAELLAGLLAVFALCAAGIVGRRLRRVGDDGDDWRSLLEGAPPAVA